MDQIIQKLEIFSKIGSSGVASIIRKLIVTGEYQKKDKLPAERLLAEKFNVSRGTIRTALETLAREGYLDILAGSGAYVKFDQPNAVISQVENASPLELIDARFALEPHICRLSVMHGRKSHFDELDELLESMETNSKDPIVFAKADTAFHKTLALSTGNSLLIWVIGQINGVRKQEQWTRARQLTLNPVIINTYNKQHRLILSYIKKREPEQASLVMKEHLETARLSLTRAVGT